MKTPSRHGIFGLAWGLVLCVPALFAQQQGHPANVVAGAIEETNLTTLTGNTRAEASAANDRGAVSDDFQLDHMLLQLQRAPREEAALETFIDGLHDADSPNFHQWLTPVSLPLNTA